MTVERDRSTREAACVHADSLCFTGEAYESKADFFGTRSRGYRYYAKVTELLGISKEDIEEEKERLLRDGNLARGSGANFTRSAQQKLVEYSPEENHRFGVARPQDGQGTPRHHVESGSQAGPDSAQHTTGHWKGVLSPEVDTSCASWFRCVDAWDMESVRVAYIDEIGQYANFDLSSDLSSGRNIAFLDTLKANVAELEDIECFLSPDTVFSFLERIGFRLDVGVPGSG